MKLRFALSCREHVREDISPFADICGQSAWRCYKRVSFVLSRFKKPLFALTTFHCSLDESFLLVRWQITSGLSRSSTHSNRNGGCSKPRPINLFAAHGG